MVYLDNAATTLIKPESVAEGVFYAVKNLGSPGRGGHSAALMAADKLQKCRELSAEMFGVGKPENVTFTSSATHGLNIAIRSLARLGMRVIISGLEHNAVTRPLYALKCNVVVVDMPVFNRKRIIDAFYKEIKKGAGLVVCTHISNVFGTVMPIKEISEMCRKKGIPLILDCSQSAGCEDIDFNQLGAAFIAFPGHKGLYGPQGTGILLCGKMPSPILFGGTGSKSLSKNMPSTLPDRLEAGTHNMPGIAGLYEGLKFVKSVGTSEISNHEKILISLAEEKLSKIRGIKLFSPTSPNEQIGVLSFTMNKMSADQLSKALGEMEIAVRGGYHCAPLAHKTAGTLNGGTVRASVSAFNSESDISALEDALKFIDSKY